MGKWHVIHSGGRINMSGWDAIVPNPGPFDQTSQIPENNNARLNRVNSPIGHLEFVTMDLEHAVQTAREAVRTASVEAFNAFEITTLVEAKIVEIDTEYYQSADDTLLTEPELIALAMAQGSTEDSDSEEDEDSEQTDSEDG